jgi:hypothetical protein
MCSPDPDDEWQVPLTDDQRREIDEIVMMVSKISDLGYRMDYSFRGYDNKHYVILEGTKCYGQAPKVHAFLSGAYALMDWSRTSIETVETHHDEFGSPVIYPPEGHGTYEIRIKETDNDKTN